MVDLDFSDAHEWALLTGAGFSANWGAPTAQSVWSSILSHPATQSCEPLRQAMLDRTNGFNFETVLFHAQAGDFGRQAAIAMDEAVMDAYDGFSVGLGYGRRADAYYLLQQFLLRDKTSFVFTLNQDMLLEELANFGHGSWVERPGVVKPPQGPAPGGWKEHNPNHSDPRLRVPVDALRESPREGWPSLKGKASYIKLHGSYDWEMPGGSHGMVLGGGKEEAIRERPLLDFYSSVFNAYINAGNKRLLVIGYGFGDGYLNQRLARAVRDNGLRMYICDPRSPEQLWQSPFAACGDWQAIWSGLCGYSNTRISDMEQYGSAADLHMQPSPGMVSFVGNVLRHAYVPWERATAWFSEFGYVYRRAVAEPDQLSRG